MYIIPHIILIALGSSCYIKQYTTWDSNHQYVCNNCTFVYKYCCIYIIL